MKDLQELMNSMKEEEKVAFEKLMKCNKKYGQYTKATWKSGLTPLAKYTEDMKGFSKVSTSIVRLGINYKNIKGVELSENNSKESWYDVVIPNVLVKHKTTGELYLRLYVGKTRAKTTKHYEDSNGKVVENLDMSMFRKSSSSNKLECFNIKLANLISLE